MVLKSPGALGKSQVSTSEVLTSGSKAGLGICISSKSEMMLTVLFQKSRPAVFIYVKKLQELFKNI